MPIIVTYINQDIIEFNSFDKITDFNLVTKINCSNNQLTSLPDNMNFPNLQHLYCHNNQLTSLPDNMNFPNLQFLYCYYNQLTSLPDNMNFPNLQELNCGANQLTSLPDNMNFPNLRSFPCSHNHLTSLPDNMNFPNLQDFDCYNNHLTSLPDNMNFPNLRGFDCNHNKLTSLSDNMIFPNLKRFRCSSNKLTSLPDNMNFPNLQELKCCYNKLTTLPDNMNLPNLQILNCSHNNLTSLPVCILNFINLTRILYENNELELSLQMVRFIHLIENDALKTIYHDEQNAHNPTIQLSIKDSINRITTRNDLKKYNIDQLNDLIITNIILTERTKSLLFEYCNDLSVHSLLLLTFSEVLWFIIQTIVTDFSDIIQEEIFKILNQEIIDAECKCFTGRINRVINCLNGFSHFVNINIRYEDQIGSVIILIKNKLILTNSYTIEEHKKEVEIELLDRGYDIETIKTWLEYIE
jgi:Leucine-rich repeat (LRR) protein